MVLDRKCMYKNAISAQISIVGDFLSFLSAEKNAFRMLLFPWVQCALKGWERYGRLQGKGMLTCWFFSRTEFMVPSYGPKAQTNEQTCSDYSNTSKNVNFKNSFPDVYLCVHKCIDTNTHTPGSMNRLFNDFFRKFEVVFFWGLSGTI